MLADTPLIKNLENPDYVKIILDGNETLEKRFAEIDAKLVREQLRKTQAECDRVPSKIRKIIRKPGRSEEHTSELQSHSFISYAVFCLKKKKTKKKTTKNTKTNRQNIIVYTKSTDP